MTYTTEFGIGDYVNIKSGGSISQANPFRIAEILIREDQPIRYSLVSAVGLLDIWTTAKADELEVAKTPEALLFEAIASGDNTPEILVEKLSQHRLTKSQILDMVLKLISEDRLAFNADRVLEVLE